MKQEFNNDRLRLKINGAVWDTAHRVRSVVSESKMWELREPQKLEMRFILN